MSTDTRTPGDWVIFSGPDGLYVATALGSRIASIRPDRHHEVANAQLMAAAPELLAALEAVLPYVPGHATGDHHARPHIPRALAAIAAAKGEA